MVEFQQAVIGMTFLILVFIVLESMEVLQTALIHTATESL